MGFENGLLFESSLFLGLPIDDLLESALDEMIPHEKELFLSKNDPMYLETITHSGKDYLGKSFGSSIQTKDLELAYNHVSSMIIKLFPHYPVKKESFYLITQTR